MSKKPIWKPSKKIIETSNIYKMMQTNSFNNYQDFWKWSVTNKEVFWKSTIQNLNIQLAENYSTILDISKGVENAEWLKNGRLNIVDSCFQNEDEAIALIYQNEDNSIQNIHLHNHRNHHNRHSLHNNLLI